MTEGKELLAGEWFNNKNIYISKGTSLFNYLKNSPGFLGVVIFFWVDLWGFVMLKR